MTIGDFKRLIDRTRGYTQYVNLFLLLSLYYENNILEWWHFLIILLVFLVGYVDNKYVQISESESIAKKNPILMEIHNAVVKKNNSNNPIHEET